MLTETQVLIKNLHKFQIENNNSKQIKILFKLTEIYFNEENFQKAKQSLKQILDINKKEKNVNYYLGLVYLNLGENILAKSYLKKELKSYPKNIEAKQLLEKININSNFPIFTLLLLILNSIVFYFTYPQITQLELFKFGLNFEFLNFSNLITSLFFHANLFHFISNMVILILFGLILEKNIGSIKFIFIYLLSGILGNLSQSFIIPGSFVIGASAAIFGIIGAILLRNPFLELKLLGILKVPILIVFGGYFIISNLLSRFYFEYFSILGDTAHLVGFLVGILIIVILYQETIDTFYGWLIIFFGFYIINLGLIYQLENILSIINFLIFLIFLFIGLLMIYFSYYKLKTIKFEEVKK